MNGKNGTIREIIITFSIFLGLGIALAWSVLAYPMAWDDLHLFRPYSGDEILSSFYGTWDPDQIETPGFRPLALLFHHFRFMIFQENVVAHRVFLIGLYALYLTIFCWVVSVLGMPWKLAILAGALSMVIKYNIYHYTWLTDGFHLLQGCLLGGAMIFLIRYLRDSSYLNFVLSLFSAVCALLTREDSLAMIPILIILGYVYIWRQDEQDQYSRVQRMHGYTIISLAICAVIVVYRHFVVPEALPLGHSLRGMATHFGYALSFMGQTPFDLPSKVLIYGWFIVLAILVVACIAYKTVVLPRIAVLWLLCAVIACSPGLTMLRVNLLLFPTTFMAFFFCSILWKIARISGFWKYAVGGIFIWIFAGSFYVSKVHQQAFHPCSSDTVRWNVDVLYGEDATKWTIPDERRDLVRKQLAGFGIYSIEDYNQYYSKMIEQAVLENRRRPDSDGRFFHPLHGAWGP